MVPRFLSSISSSFGHFAFRCLSRHFLFEYLRLSTPCEDNVAHFQLSSFIGMGKYWPTCIRKCVTSLHINSSSGHFRMCPGHARKGLICQFQRFYRSRSHFGVRRTCMRCYQATCQHRSPCCRFQYSSPFPYSGLKVFTPPLAYLIASFARNPPRLKYD